MACDQRKVNLWTSRVVPIVLLGAFGYATYVVVSPLSINYFLHPDPLFDGVPRRPGLAAAILTIYFVLLTIVLGTMFRVNYVLLTNPGYVERSELWYQHHPEQDKRKKRRRSKSKSVPGDVENGHLGLSTAPPGLDQFTSREVFSCDHNGYPIWCSHCLNYKPDRAHHCSEVGRCVRKMDHFCPWVGGVVGETSFKFFIQFVTYAAIYCIFNVIVFAYFIAERSRTSFSGRDVHWIVALALAAFFGLFTLGMSLHSLWYAARNLTTIEDLNRKWKVWEMAVRVPDPATVGKGVIPHETPDYTRTVVFQSPATNGMAEKAGSEGTRTFALLHSAEGENIWDMGRMKNLRSVMGNSILEWLLPIKQSPCADHSSTECAFGLGVVGQRLKTEAAQYAVRMAQSPKDTEPSPTPSGAPEPNEHATTGNGST